MNDAMINCDEMLPMSCASSPAQSYYQLVRVLMSNGLLIDVSLMESEWK